MMMKLEGDNLGDQTRLNIEWKNVVCVLVVDLDDPADW